MVTNHPILPCCAMMLPSSCIDRPRTAPSPGPLPDHPGLCARTTPLPGQGLRPCQAKDYSLGPCLATQPCLAPMQIPLVCEACGWAGHINVVVTPPAIEYVILHCALLGPLEVAFHHVLENLKRVMQCAIPHLGHVDRAP